MSPSYSDFHCEPIVANSASISLLHQPSKGQWVLLTPNGEVQLPISIHAPLICYGGQDWLTTLKRLHRIHSCCCMVVHTLDHSALSHTQTPSRRLLLVHHCHIMGPLYSGSGIHAHLPRSKQSVVLGYNFGTGRMGGHGFRVLDRTVLAIESDYGKSNYPAKDSYHDHFERPHLPHCYGHYLGWICRSTQHQTRKTAACMGTCQHTLGKNTNHHVLRAGVPPFLLLCEGRVPISPQSICPAWKNPKDHVPSPWGPGHHRGRRHRPHRCGLCGPTDAEAFHPLIHLLSQA